MLLTLDRAGESESLFREVTTKAPDDLGAWEGLVAAMMKGGRDQAAYSALLSMSAANYQEALKRSGFLRSAALLQAKYGKSGSAEELLRRVLASPMSPADRESALLMLASTALARGDTKEADDVASQLVEANPNNMDGWKVVISAKQQGKLPGEALEASRRIPPAIAARLQEDPDFIALMAAVEASTGDAEAAIRSVRSALERFSALHKPQPAGLLLQLGWLQLNSGSDEKELYSTLTSLRMRKDLSPDQIRGFQEIWSVWVRRRAEKARKDGDFKGAVAILDAGTKLLPKDHALRQALAGALLDAGDTRRAFNVYRAILASNPTAEEWTGAIGTAIKLNEPVGQQWLKYALQRFPREPALLELAGRQAASKGEYARAQTYWRQAIAVGEAQITEKPGSLSFNDPHRALGALLLGGDPTAAGLDFGGIAGGPEAPGTFGLFPFIDQKKPKALDEQLKDELSSLDGRNAPYLGGGPRFMTRGGRAGFERRVISEADIEASVVLGSTARLTVTATPTMINAGASDGTTTLRLGMLPADVAFDALSQSGLAAKGEISTQTFGLWGGITPEGFLVQNFVGGFRFQPVNGPVTIVISREPLKDTLLSYAGVRDPVSNQVFGGVISTGGTVRADFGGELGGYYFGGGYHQLQGRNVLDNTSFEGMGGTFKRVLTRPEGSLNVGLFAMGLHYEYNLRYFTFGQGGYYSPQRYFLVGAPIAWRGVWKRRLEYSLSGNIGVQNFHEDSSPYFPTQPLLQGLNGPTYPALSSTGVNYSLEFRWLYQFNPNWFLGGLINMNNSSNYTAQSLSFFLRYSPKGRTLGSDYWLPSVPDWRGKQPFHLE